MIVCVCVLQNELKATRLAVDSGSASRQMQDNINKFKKFVSQKMIEYLESTSKC